MNLIEQLGGYERAKRIEKNIYGTGGRLIRYPSKDFDYNDDGGNVCDVELISFKANDLKKSLLEHRRENNIYEVGDYVLRNDGFYNVLRITGIDNGCADLVRRVDGEPRWSRFKLVDIHHATPEEIQAGRRL